MTIAEMSIKMARAGKAHDMHLAYDMSLTHFEKVPRAKSFLTPKHAAYCCVSASFGYMCCLEQTETKSCRKGAHDERQCFLGAALSCGMRVLQRAGNGDGQKDESRKPRKQCSVQPIRQIVAPAGVSCGAKLATPACAVVGACEGADVGFIVGRCVDVLVGAAVGASVGAVAGVLVGDSVGGSVGVAVGATDGFPITGAAVCGAGGAGSELTVISGGGTDAPDASTPGACTEQLS